MYTKTDTKPAENGWVDYVSSKVRINWYFDLLSCPFSFVFIFSFEISLQTPFIQGDAKMSNRSYAESDKILFWMTSVCMLMPCHSKCVAAPLAMVRIG